MARPVNADAEATRARIRGCALALFAEHGIDGVSVRTIAGAAGVSLAMVHHYFGSKAGLYAACVEAMYAELAEARPRLVAAVVDRGRPGATLDRIVRESFRYGREHQVAVRLVQRTLVTAGEADAKHRDAVQAPFLDEMSRAVGALLGRDAASVRMPLQSISALITRYAISSEGELTMMTGERDAGAAVAAVEDHLARAARALLGLAPDEDHEDHEDDEDRR